MESHLNLTDIISEINKSHWKGVIANTGCAPGLAGELLQPGGGSATVLEAVVPYATKALKQFIGHIPKKFCSKEVAQEMASAAFSRANELKDSEKDVHTPVFGLGITATLRKNGPEREGRVHQVFIAYQTSNLGYTHHIVFNNTLDRVDEERLVTLVALDILTRHILNKRCDVSLVLKNHLIVNITDDNREGRISWFVDQTTNKQLYPRTLNLLLHGSNSAAAWARDKIDLRGAKAIISGSFNPFHEGHRSMVNVAAKALNTKPILELSISNMDKGRLSGFEVLKRVDAFEALRNNDGEDFADFIVTDSPSFEEKARMFPGATFIVGIDTWFRLIDPKYYGHSEEACQESLDKIADKGCSFLVLGRRINGQYHTLPTDKKTRGLAVGVAEEDFRVDVSSTQIRSAR